MDKYSEELINIFAYDYCSRNNYKLVDSNIIRYHSNYMDVEITYIFQSFTFNYSKSNTIFVAYKDLDELIMKQRSNKIKNILNG